MARQLRHWVAEPSTCAYLPDRIARLEYRLLLDVTPTELDALLDRGWRRFGPAYFRPACGSCQACVSLRIPVAEFRPNKSQRRAYNKTKDWLRVEEGRPRVDARRLDLYHRWHLGRGATRGWASDHLDAEEYRYQFAFHHPSARELTYWDDRSSGSGPPRLIGVAMTDITPNGLSAVYTYHDPDYAAFSLGTVSILHQIERARALGRRWVYLGYRVLGCRSSEYKASFRPHELLEASCAFDEQPRWSRAPEAG